MHGFGPTILLALPRQAPGASSREIQAHLEEKCVRKPSLSTIRAHLHTLIGQGLVIRTRATYGNPRYFRVDDALEAQEVAAC